MEYDAVTIYDILFLNEIPVYKFNDYFSDVKRWSMEPHWSVKSAKTR